MPNTLFYEANIFNGQCRVENGGHREHCPLRKKMATFPLSPTSLHPLSTSKQWSAATAVPETTPYTVPWPQETPSVAGNVTAATDLAIIAVTAFELEVQS
jgi:hypothetical protein